MRKPVKKTPTPTVKNSQPLRDVARRLQRIFALDWIDAAEIVESGRSDILHAANQMLTVKSSPPITRHDARTQLLAMLRRSPADADADMDMGVEPRAGDAPGDVAARWLERAERGPA